jgi:cation diffusion facilitator family transporter
MTVMQNADEQHAHREKNAAALSSVLAAIFLTFFKLVVGLMTGSLGILAEVAHSGLDLVAALVTLVAVRLSGRPADEEHMYGHGKVENLSALFETLLLLGTCAWIIYEAIRRLFFEEVTVQVNIWAFIVMGVAIVVDFSRSRLLYRTAKKYDSQALEADALHFSTDIWSSAVVIAGLVFVLLSERLGIPALAKADAIAALVVAGIVVYVSMQLGGRTVTALIDGVPASLRDELIRAVRVPGVLEVRRVRVRRSGPESFADVRLTVARDTPFERTHDIAQAAEQSLRQVLPGADVVVQVDPVKSDHEGVLTSVRMLAAQHGMGAHGVRTYDLQSGGHLLELHLEVSDRLTVEQAHEQASAFEEELRKTLPAIDQVITHIEPTSDALAQKHATSADEEHVRDVLRSLDLQNDLGCQPHDITVRRVGGELQVTFHCTVDSSLPITEAHALTERVESLLRNQVNNLGRVVIHVEPSKGEPHA